MHEDGEYIAEILGHGSQQSINNLVTKYELQIFNLCFRIVRSRERAEEIAQDAFLKSLRELGKLEDHSKFHIWINRIAYHMSIDETRKKKRVFEDLTESRNALQETADPRWRSLSSWTG